MSRPLRIEYPDAWYHVMNRGRRFEDIFEKVQDYHLFIRVLHEVSEMFGLKISSYCLMPNHYHLLVQTPYGNLSRCMRHINGVYTQRFNRSHEIDGSLFRGRYKAVCVADDQHLLEVMRYIHNNPVKASLVSKVEEYLWSSHAGYLSKAKKWAWLNSQVLLDMLERKTSKQKAAYLDFMACENSEEIEKFYSLKKLLPVMGGDAFKERVVSLVGDVLHKDEVEVRSVKDFCVSVETILTTVINHYEITREELFYTRRGYSNVPRDISLYLLQKYRQDTLQEIGHYFGIKKYSSVSSGIIRAKKVMIKSKNVSKAVHVIEENLAKSQRQT